MEKRVHPKHLQKNTYTHKETAESKKVTIKETK